MRCIPAICFLVAAPGFALGLFAPNLWLGWLLFALGQMLALAWLGPVIAAVQHIVPPNMRATASASFLFINNLIGIGFGIFFLGFMSDADEGRPWRRIRCNIRSSTGSASTC